MQLRNARLCLDCDEVHDEGRCPMCASESFAFIKRWVPASERRAGQRPPDAEATNHETVNTYKELLSANDRSRLSTWQLVRGGAVSLAVLGAAGWLLRRNATASLPPGGTNGASDDARQN
jgi:hypothetical protein